MPEVTLTHRHSQVIGQKGRLNVSNLPALVVSVCLFRTCVARLRPNEDGEEEEAEEREERQQGNSFTGL